ncbi:hypothetical protein GM3708_1573 [Geminocystis sp. NIES-3708]|uniref:hypothetical protein n=1 Tax=Geminocystis sp. NIES-3708 TaxID=1615909 RepID=UPI0005FCD621|nr:hypothetical protein [Geminocystis sp. NIES-3708]BAQ61167.1 hypothetical protein GM3708_1573 [Geminocystis sp. NIES-3708]
MKKLSLSVISALVLLTGCTGGEETSTVAPIPPQNPTPTPIPETSQNNQSNQSNNISSSSGLIPSTNPQDRLNEISQGRNDPFDTINPPAIIRVKTDQIISESVATNKAILKEAPKVVNSETTGKANNTAPNMGKNTTANTSSPSDRRDANITNINGKSSLPFQPPSPNDAQNIIVSGILNLNGENVALIQTPWDGMTRSVRVGDIISDNTSGIRVRVKDINFGYPTTIALRENNQTVLRSVNDDNGVVVLEQFGQRVTRQIGENNKDEKNVAKL